MLVGELAKKKADKTSKTPFYFENNLNHAIIPPNYCTFVRQIIAWTALFLAVRQSDDKDSPVFRSPASI